MKIRYLIFLCLLLVQLGCTSQTYSNIISDLVIEETMEYVIRQMYTSSLGGDRFTPGKVDKVVVEWRELFDFKIDSLHLIKDVLPRKSEDTLKSIPELFDTLDFKYMALQISQETGGRWQLPPNNIKYVKNCKMGCTRFSTPLFNVNHTKAIIYEEEIYNPIAACGLIKIYILENHQWKEYKSIGIWLM